MNKRDKQKKNVLHVEDIPRDLRTRFRKACKEKGKTVRDVVRGFLEEYCSAQ